MRILFLTQVLPYPLDAGPKVRAYYVLRHLARQHEVTLVSFVRPTDTEAALAHLQSYCRAVHTIPIPRSRLHDLAWLGRSLLTARPFLIARDWVPAMADLLIQGGLADQPFDVIHADQLWMAPYALWASRHAQGPRPRLILDQHNAVYRIPQRLAQTETNPVKRLLMHLEARKVARYEQTICRQFDQVVWVTQADCQAVQALTPTAVAPTAQATIIPICVDPAEAPIQRQPQARRVTFIGGLHYPPNAQGICWFAEAVFPQILQAVPDAILTVIGKAPPAKLKHLGIPEQNLATPGFVADVRPYLAESALMIVPLHAGGGMRVKILDAWRWGIPVVSTTVGAEGLDLAPGSTILLADEPAALAQATIRLLQQPDCGAQMAAAGRAWVETHYNWHTRYQAWDQLYSARRVTPERGERRLA